MPTMQETKELVSKVIAGSSVLAAANQLGIPKSSAYDLVNRDDIQAKIKAAQTKLINDSLQKAIENQSSKIEISQILLNKFSEGQELPDNSKTILELGDRAEGKLLESVGIHPSHTQSITLTNIMVDNSVNLSPSIEAMLTERLGQVSEAEYDDDDLDG